jgi:hypothetical protein
MTPARIQCCGLSNSMRTTNRISKIVYPVIPFLQSHAQHQTCERAYSGYEIANFPYIMVVLLLIIVTWGAPAAAINITTVCTIHFQHTLIIAICIILTCAVVLATCLCSDVEVCTTSTPLEVVELWQFDAVSNSVRTSTRIAYQCLSVAACVECGNY